ncbi:sacsin N-terminal ATP-binding-like domain-containing protein [Dapis sp. BLCC M126]|uniref:sacsin N-terminal ATP-binding-like domain-containing protein n=1 Tax=Dapis sp. BLCC M126 TaxID=3400189 RepID=UPI003CE9CDBE
MVSNQEKIGGKFFYQSEPLIARLRGIIRDYPEGVGILKELIQNADDAKATKVEIILDWRIHQFKNLPDNRMEKLMGPAILVYNNQVFRDQDFESIKSLGQSKKSQDLQKTGRFGVGFNAIYHVTDFPSFISRQSLIFFDPHGAAIPGTSRQEPGREWNVAAEKWYEQYPDFMKVYEAGGLLFGTEDFQGTLFRLPLRTEIQAKNSEIRKQAFTESNVRELIEELVKSGEEILLFLKSIVEIRVYEILADGNGEKLEVLSIVTQNVSEVEAARNKLLSAIPDDVNSLVQQCQNNPTGLVEISYRHNIETVMAERTINSIWRIVGIIRTDGEGELEKVIQAMYESQEKVIPWSGAAARISSSSSDGNVREVKGKIYCFLPLPLESELPIHINGFFNLNSSRDNLSSDSGQTGKDRPRAVWNYLLMRHVVAHAYANLITTLVEDIGKYQPQKFYDFFPTIKVTTSKALEELYIFVIRLLYQRNVIQSGVEYLEAKEESRKQAIATKKWITPAQIKILPKSWHRKLVAPLSADEIDISEPRIPDKILSAFAEAGCRIPEFKPADLRNHLRMNQSLGLPLKNAPKASLKHRQWVIDMLGYCVEDNYQDLQGLPLAILANNSLQVFGYGSINPIFIPTSEIQREIFADYPEWFLHSDLCQGINLYRKEGVSYMNTTEVARNLTNIVDSTQWRPTGENLPNEKWLILVYRYFTRENLPVDELNKIPLVPGNDDHLYRGGLVETPLLCRDNIDEKIIAAIKYFGVNLIEASKELEEAIFKFFDRHPETLIWKVTAPDVLDSLYAIYESQGLPIYQEQHYTTLLNYLADSTWLNGDKKYSPARKEKLRQLPIYLTVTDEIVSLNEENIYLPAEGYQPPEFIENFRLLKLGLTEYDWLPLFKFLGVPILSRARLITDCLLPEYPTLAHEEQLIVLTWIRDNFGKVQTELELETSSQNFDKFKQQIKSASLVRCTDGRLRSIESIYSPEIEIVPQIMGNKTAIPDMNFYSDKPGEWLNFFAELGMKKIMTAADLLNSIDNLIQKANRFGVDSVSESLLNIFDYILDNWEDVKSEKLLQNLQAKYWLPAQRNPEVLSQYAAALIPEPKLYRSQDLCLIEEAHLVASQKPIFAGKFAVKSQLLKAKIRHELGFLPVEANIVLDHFETIIGNWENDQK